MAYDSADYVIRREYCAASTGGATAEYCKFRHFQAMRLVKVHAAVIVAGTNAGHGYDVYRGTTSIGTIALGTAVAGTADHSALLNETVGTMEQISVKSLVDATGTAHIVYEFEVTPDAVES